MTDQLFMEEREGQEPTEAEIMHNQQLASQQLFESIEVPQLLQDTTKEDRANFVSAVIEQIESGEIDALKIQLQLKCTESMIEMFSDTKKFPATATKYKGLLMDAASKYGKQFTYMNADFQEKEAGTKWDYSKCNDAEIADLHTRLKSLQADIKIREDFLKTVPVKGLEILDKDSGEMITIYPPAKSSTTIIQATLK